jgi:hypothetical protein
MVLCQLAKTTVMEYILLYYIIVLKVMEFLYIYHLRDVQALDVMGNSDTFVEQTIKVST